MKCTCLVALFICFQLLCFSQNNEIENFVQSRWLDTLINSNNKKISNVTDSIIKYRQYVWEAWKKQNIDSLLFVCDTNYIASLKLPEKLEPHAQLNYRFLSFGKKNDKERLPLFIYLHGSGPREQEFLNGYKICKSIDYKNAYFFIPQIPQEGIWYRWYQKSKQWMLENILKSAFINDKIDPLRIYLFGISEGGYGAQRIASFYADYFAAVGAMAGGEPLRNAPAENLRNTVFSLRTGELDNGFYRNVLTQITKDALDSLSQKFPGDYLHWTTLIPNKGHFINYTQTPSWLSLWKRHSLPNYITWEDYPMDGRYRRGFQNILILKRPKSERTQYDISLKNNHININIRKVDYKVIDKDTYYGIEKKFRRTLSPIKGGKIRLFLNEKQVDFNRAIIVYVNGKKRIYKHIETNLNDMILSLSTFYDPLRIFPAHIDIQY